MSRLMKAMALVALLLVTVFPDFATAKEDCDTMLKYHPKKAVPKCGPPPQVAVAPRRDPRFSTFGNSGIVKYANAKGIDLTQPKTNNDFPCNKQAHKDADGGAACRDYPANTGNIWRLVFDGRRVAMSAHNLDTGAWASFNDMTHQLAHEEPGSDERPAYTGAGSSAPITREIVPEAVGDSARKALGSLLGR